MLVLQEWRKIRFSEAKGTTETMPPAVRGRCIPSTENAGFTRDASDEGCLRDQGQLVPEGRAGKDQDSADLPWGGLRPLTPPSALRVLH